MKLLHLLLLLSSTLWLLLFLSIPISASPALEKRLDFKGNSCNVHRDHLTDGYSTSRKMGKISAAAVKKYMTKPDKAKKDRKVKATKDGLEALFKIHNYPANKVQENLKKIREYLKRNAKINKANIQLYCDPKDWLTKTDTKGKTWGGNAPPQGKTYWYDRVFNEWAKLDDGFCTGKRAFNTAAPSHATRGQPRDVVTVCSLAWHDADILPILSRLKTSLRPGRVYRIHDLVRGIAGTLFHEFTHTSPNSGDEYTLDLPAKDSQGRSSPTNTWAKLLLLSAEDAIRNAESYAALAVGLYLVEYGYEVNWQTGEAWIPC